MTVYCNFLTECIFSPLGTYFAFLVDLQILRVFLKVSEKVKIRVGPFVKPDAFSNAESENLGCNYIAVFSVKVLKMY